MPPKGNIHKQMAEKSKYTKETLEKQNIVRFIPIIASAITLVGLIIGATVTLYNENQRRKLEIITYLKRDLASTNHVTRQIAYRALADYPKEAIPILLAGLGSTEKDGEGNLKEDTVCTSAAASSLRQLREKAVKPLAEELTRLKTEIMKPLLKGKDENTTTVCRRLPLAMFLEDEEKLDEEIKIKITETLKFLKVELDDDKIEELTNELKDIRSSKYQAILAHKNGRDAFADLLRLPGKYKRLNLGSIDLSDTDLYMAQLSGADLTSANLCDARLRLADLSGAKLEKVNLAIAYLERADLSSANLKNATLSGANLKWADLLGADLYNADLSGADLTFAILSGARLEKTKLYGVIGFRELEELHLHNAVFEYVEGLSQQDLEYAKSKGAIVKPSPKESP